MVGRGGGKNVGNRNKDGRGAGGHQTRAGGHQTRAVAVSRRLLNQNQSEGNPAANQLQNEVEPLDQIERTQNHDVDMNLSGNPVVANESEGHISPKSRVTRKRKNNLLERLNMTLKGPDVMDPPTRRSEQEAGENARNRRQDHQVVANRGSAHSANNADTTQNGEVNTNTFFLVNLHISYALYMNLNTLT